MSTPFPNAPASRGYPLGALFVLVTAAATLIAGLAPVLRTFGDDETDVEAIAASVVGCLLLGGMLGGILGLFQYRWLVGGSVGAVAGASVGIVAGLLLFAPANLLPGIALAMVAGSGLIVGVALVMRPKAG